MSGIGEEMGDVGMAIQRAEDKTAQMQARAGAIDELIASGALDDASSLNSGDDIARELEAMSSQSEVEAELAKLKAGQAPAGDRGRQGRRHPPGEPEAPPSHRRAEVTPPHAIAPPALRDTGPRMIVRILGEGQYDLSDDAVAALNDLDARSSPRSRPATRRRSTTRWRRCSTAYARPERRTTPDSLEPSDLILPMADASLAEVRDMLSGDGLIRWLGHWGLAWHALDSPPTPGSPPG